MEEKKLLDLELENHPLSEHTLEHTWIVHTFLKILNNFQKVMEFFDGILFSIKELKTSCQFISKSVDEIEKKSNKNRELWNTFADEWENWKKNQKEKYFFQRSALLSL
jgi:hypothetical protein